MLCSKLTIRESTPADTSAIHNVEKLAFGRVAEANLVNQLIPAPEHTISIVAICDGSIIGHVLLTEIISPVRALALAPLAVAPAFREMLVGTELVKKAIQTASNSRFQAIFVLGASTYYERFGFSSAKADPFSVKWQGRHFLALELEEGCLEGKSGPLNYPQPFLDL